MNHLVLLGDSIFDNAAYVGKNPSVINQVRCCISADWKASLLAVDGDTTIEVQQQLQRLPDDVSHLVLSVGGNDALGCIPALSAPAASVMKALDTLTAIQSKFQESYRSLIRVLLALEKPLLVCTIYDQVPGLSNALKTALDLFNSVILREAIAHGLPVLDLRMVCTESSDYSEKSPIEPSSQGGAKLADRLVASVLQHDFSRSGCSVYL